MWVIIIYYIPNILYEVTKILEISYVYHVIIIIQYEILITL